MMEGFYKREVDAKTIAEYFSFITDKLNLSAYGDPIIFSPAGMGKGENQGFDAFIPLIDSGISHYVWTSERFLSVIIYTCKAFDTEEAIAQTKYFYQMTEDFIAEEFWAPVPQMNNVLTILLLIYHNMLISSNFWQLANKWMITRGKIISINQD